MTAAQWKQAPVALIILDGWGVAPASAGNAVDLAHTPTFDRISSSCPRTTLVASGEQVGLPAGQIGNSEVGHLNLGAGRVVYQDLTRIDRAVADGSLDESPVLQAAVDAVVTRGASMHVVALCSRGGVHSSIAHVERVVERAAAGGCRRVLVHALTDGRDVSPDASLTDIPALERACARIGDAHHVEVRVATVTGRYWTMDRDQRWDRTRRGYDAIIHSTGAGASDTATAAVMGAHATSVTDEFIEPTIIGSPAPVVAGDVVFLANFRPDRMRQLLHALTDPAFDGFDRGVLPRIDVVCMTQYEQGIDVPVVFAPNELSETLADTLEGHGVGQMHVAETEKYAHVTYFFNGGIERVHHGEARSLIPSPRDVATYDLRPQMSATGVADAFIDGFADPDVGFAVVNFANPDMVGHTGSIPAAIEACEHVDRQLARVLAAIELRGGYALVTADHGNAECMLTESGAPHTAHTTNPVPLVLVGDASGDVVLRDGGRLADIAPTVLDLLELHQPGVMSGQSLVSRVASSAV